jgi:hypothetical protein
LSGDSVWRCEYARLGHFSHVSRFSASFTRTPPAAAGR